MLIENTAQIKAEDNLVMIVYGKGGVGKTTFAASAPKTLILDFENGTKYLGERGLRADVARFSAWLNAKDKDDLLKVLPNYQTIVIDPLGEAMEKLIDCSDIKGKQYRTGDGGLTMAGWGEVKKQMRNFIKFLRDTGKNVIIVSHVAEIKTEQGLEHRIQVATKLSDEIPNMVEIISYMGLQKKEDELVRVLYTPAQGGSFDSKDRSGRVPMTVEVSELNGWTDFISAMRPPQESPKTSTLEPSEQAPVEPPQQEQAPPLQPQKPGNKVAMIDESQIKEMKSLATRMPGTGGNYLLQKAAQQITHAEANGIIVRAVNFLGGR
jgi:hypothetical protein